jgi:N-acetylglucosamine-6-phosphate deacetylase
MEYLIKNISVVSLNNIEVKDVHIKDGIFYNISNSINLNDINIIDGTGLFMLPPFYDSHTHGGYGLDFGPKPIDTEVIEEYLSRIPSEGSGSVILSSVTSSIEDILKIKENYKKIKSLDKHNICKGIHLEGPWINSSKKGAHDPSLIKEKVLIEDLEKVLDSDIAFLTVAPENEGLNKAISHFKNITNFSIGHSSCSQEQAKASSNAGARRVTHIFNAMSGFGNREMGLVNEAFINTNLFVEIITDNKHTTPESSLAAYKAIGSDRLMVISDCWSIKAKQDGDYYLSNTWVTKKGSTVYLKDLPTLAGSAMPINELLKIAVKDFQCSMIDLLKISSYNHFISLNQEPDLINLKSAANFCIIDMDINVHYTFLNGEKKYGK